jgi:predicted nuclease of predicted toxin-antitoxin system
LLEALSILPEYLRTKATESGAVIDYRDWQVPLGRRFRALKLWFVIRSYGVAALQEMVREHVRLAQEFATRVTESSLFAARAVGSIIMSKDADFVELVARHGPPPQILWVTCGNTTNDALQAFLLRTLPDALRLIEAGEPLVRLSEARSRH